MFKMKELKTFDIPFVGLKEGKHDFEYQIDNTFFDAFEYDEFMGAAIQVKLDFVKKATLLELNFTSEGTVKVPCDVSGEPFDLEVQGTLALIVKFGEEDYDDGNEEIMYVSHTAHKVNVGHPIFEMVVLSVPARRVRPDIEDGSITSEAQERLETYQIKEKKEDTTDPRWGKLKDLLIDKK